MRARRVSAVVHLLFRPCDTHLRAKDHAKLPGSAPRAGKFARTAGNDFREMEDSTRCGQARNPEETRELSDSATNIRNELTAARNHAGRAVKSRGMRASLTTAKINSRTRAILGELR